MQKALINWTRAQGNNELILTILLCTFINKIKKLFGNGENFAELKFAMNFITSQRWNNGALKHLIRMFSSRTLHAQIMQGPNLFCYNGFCGKNLSIDIQTKLWHLIMYHDTFTGTCFELIHHGTLTGGNIKWKTQLDLSSNQTPVAHYSKATESNKETICLLSIKLLQ